MKRTRKYTAADLVRQVVFAWLCAALIEFLLLPAGFRNLSGLQGLAKMNFARVIVLTGIFTAFLWGLWQCVDTTKAERWGIVTAFGLLSIAALVASYSAAFLWMCLLLLLILVMYALFGWDSSTEMATKQKKDSPLFAVLTAALAIGFFAFVSAWTVNRVRSMSTPSFDFGIFSQMFYYMKETGLPLTTIERDGLLSHFAVHMSPIYYLMLPFYCIVPKPATLQVLQAAVLASSVIPLWLIGKQHGLSSLQRTLACALLLLYPAFSGGTSYDIHENCFLTPLILWLLYGIDKKNIAVTAVAAVLTAMVKEDAAVYVGIVAVYLLLRSLLRRQKGERWGIVAGGSLLVGALAYFFAVTGYLASSGDGVMTYRYSNFLFGDSKSLVIVIAAVVMNPMKAFFECVDSEKLTFIAQTMLPLLGLPLLTRRFERYILLIPYVLINLMSDYQYQHDIYFQYTFGSTACLIYLVTVNMADIKLDLYRVGALAVAVAMSLGFFCSLNVPKAKHYAEYCVTYETFYDDVRSVLDVIPNGASVTATTFYTTDLSQREILYDIQYCSQEHMLSTEYIALNVKSTSAFKKYGGYEGVVKLLTENGYVPVAERPGILAVYQKMQ